jgi:hypothetical protein
MIKGWNKLSRSQVAITAKNNQVKRIYRNQFSHLDTFFKGEKNTPTMGNLKLTEVGKDWESR